MTHKDIDYLFHENPYRLDRCVTKSPEWFSDEIRDLKKEYGKEVYGSGSIIYARQKRTGKEGLTEIIVPGNIYTYIYEPPQEEKQIRPYYDIMPLTLVFEAEDGWFRGLNFHYIPYRPRIQLLWYLMRHSTVICPETGSFVLNEHTRLPFDWNTEKDSVVGHLIQLLTRRYLVNRSRTKFKYIEPHHWALMMMMPCEQFVKEDVTKIWADMVDRARVIRNGMQAKDDMRLSCSS